jgi:1-aminocyclopropane-1-carboxylate deaminase/D-cysteine desulfhydrase-like pyridoxal-dependent ACC family enzyme
MLPPESLLLPPNLRNSFERLPRLELGQWPTPLDPCPRLAAAIGVSELWVKRDDQSGPALGGNKVRHLEYTLAEALAQRAHAVLIAVGEQSNHARQMAALARRVGLRPIVIVNRNTSPDILRGNLLLVALTGADVRYLSADGYEQDMERHCDAVVAEYAKCGMHVYRIRPPRSQVLGAAAGLRALLELKRQVNTCGIAPSIVVLSAANGSQAGMLLASRAIGWDVQIRGVAPVLWREPLHERTARFGNLLAQELGWPIGLASSDIVNDLSQVGEGYQQASKASLAAVRLAAETEGIFLDPGYTGKALAGLIADLRTGAVSRQASIVFWHTGGVPALFSADALITEHLHAHQQSTESSAL